MNDDHQPEQTDDETLTHDITDEALEAAAAMDRPAFTLSMQPIFCRFC